MITVREIEKPVIEDRENNFTYNRYDLIYDDKNYFWEINSNNIKYYVQGHEEKNHMYLGIWLSNIPTNVIDCLCSHIKKNYKNINKIVVSNYHNVINKRSSFFRMRLCDEDVHWKIKLPKDSNDLLISMSSKFRYNLQREIRIINERLGKYEVVEYELDDIPKMVVERFFSFKKATFDKDYNLTPSDYIKRFHITNAYALIIKDKVEAMLFSCEHTKTVYLENLSYNPEFSKYSLGKVLYYHYLELLIDKGTNILYLGNGMQQYKSWYGSIKDETYSFVEYVHFLDFLGKIVSIVTNKIKKKISF